MNSWELFLNNIVIQQTKLYFIAKKILLLICVRKKGVKKITKHTIFFLQVNSDVGKHKQFLLLHYRLSALFFAEEEKNVNQVEKQKNHSFF